jgi:hypothetical protein
MVLPRGYQWWEHQARRLGCGGVCIEMTLGVCPWGRIWFSLEKECLRWHTRLQHTVARAWCLGIVNYLDKKVGGNERLPLLTSE